MKNCIFFVLLVIVLGCKKNDQNQTIKDSDLLPNGPKIKVYLLGTFHFSQTDSTYNVLDEKHQKSIEELTNIIARQKPNKIFVERQPEFESQNKVDSLYNYYTKMTRPLKAKNEIYQVGFRAARQLGHKKVYQCDHPGQYGLYYRKALKYAKENDQMKYFNATAKSSVLREEDRIDEDSLRNNSSLVDYLRWLNSDVVVYKSHASYVVNAVQVGSKDYYSYDDEDTLLGADIVTDWYRRNILIYTKMINQLNYEEDAIFLIMGADHIPILAHLFNSNPYFEVIKTDKWLK